ncbi:hypothetical protein Bpfe_027663, partial [Biomphalaria pfeifferi]
MLDSWSSFPFDLGDDNRWRFLQHDFFLFLSPLLSWHANAHVLVRSQTALFSDTSLRRMYKLPPDIDNDKKESPLDGEHGGAE